MKLAQTIDIVYALSFQLSVSLNGNYLQRGEKNIAPF